MAFLDLFKTRKANQLNDLVWQALWAQVKSAPEGDAATGELYLVYVGTLLHATRYQAALAAGMADTVARTAALQVIGKAGYDKPLEDRVLNVFSLAAENPTAGYAAALNAQIARLVGLARDTGGVPEAREVEGVVALFAALCEQLGEPVER